MRIKEIIREIWLDLRIHVCDEYEKFCIYATIWISFVFKAIC